MVALSGLLMAGFIATIAAPLNSARGAWVCIYGLALVLLLCLASVLPYPPLRTRRGTWSFTLLGAVCGVAWSCGLRSFMAEVAGRESHVDWAYTFGFILLPEMMVGALLGPDVDFNVTDTRASSSDPTDIGHQPNLPWTGTLSGSSGPCMGSTGAGGRVSGVSGESVPGSSGTCSSGSIGG